MYLLHLRRGVEIDGRNIDWLPYRAGFRFSFPSSSRPRNYFWDSSIVHVSRSPPPACAAHPRHYLRPPTSRRYYRPRPQVPCSQPPASCIFLHTLADISSPAQSVQVVMSISRYYPLSFPFYVSRAINRIGSLLISPRISRLHDTFMCPLPISNDVVNIVGQSIV